DLGTAFPDQGAQFTRGELGDMGEDRLDEGGSHLGPEVSDPFDDDPDAVEIDPPFPQHLEQAGILVGKGDGEVDALLGAMTCETVVGAILVGSQFSAGGEGGSWRVLFSGW